MTCPYTYHRDIGRMLVAYLDSLPVSSVQLGDQQAFVRQMDVIVAALFEAGRFGAALSLIKSLDRFSSFDALQMYLELDPDEVPF